MRSLGELLYRYTNPLRTKLELKFKFDQQTIMYMRGPIMLFMIAKTILFMFINIYVYKVL